MTMNLDEFSKEQLWALLVEAAHANVMYPTHKAYVRDVMLPSKPDISAKKLSLELNLTFGEALVLLDELTERNKSSL